MKPVEAQFIFDVEENECKTRQRQRKAGKVNKGVRGIAYQASECKRNVVSDHKVWVCSWQRKSIYVPKELCVDPELPAQPVASGLIHNRIDLCESGHDLNVIFILVRRVLTREDQQCKFLNPGESFQQRDNDEVLSR
jgi:hypothetical protein